jgi:hypothetical protein
LAAMRLEERLFTDPVERFSPCKVDYSTIV